MFTSTALSWPETIDSTSVTKDIIELTLEVGMCLGFLSNNLHLKIVDDLLPQCHPVLEMKLQLKDC